MRPHFALSFGLFSLGWTVAQGNVVNQTALAELSPCVMQCAGQALITSDCNPTDPCFCESKPLAKSLGICLQSNCSFSDGLAALKFQASTCNHPVRNLGAIDALFFTLYSFATLFTIARVFSRLRRFGGAGLWWDDYAAVLSWFPLTAATAGDYHAGLSGGGVDIWGLSVQNVHDFLFWFYIVTVLYVPILLLTKVSLVLLYMRIWPGELSFQTGCRVALVFLSATYVAFQIVSILQCIPISSQWSRIKDPTVQGTCIQREAWLWSFASIVIAFDFVVLLLPVPKLLKLKVKNSRKAGLCAVFLVGLVVTAFSFVRLKYIRGISMEPNLTRVFSFVGIYGNVEVYLGQICCCVPTIPGLVRRTHRYFTGKPLKSSTSTTYTHTGGSTQGTLVEAQDDSPIIDKTFRDSNASAPTIEDGVLEPVVNRQLNALPRFAGSGADDPSIAKRDYVEPRLFPADNGWDGWRGLASPSPAFTKH